MTDPADLGELWDLLHSDARRLFDGYGESSGRSELQRHEGFVVGRLLESGDSNDLRRLAKTVPEERWRSWFERQGGLGLSARSRVFWSLLLGAEPPEPPALRREIWPL